MAERFSEDSDGGNLLEGMSLTDSQADDPSEHWWKEHQECLQPWNCDGNTSTCLNGCGVTTSQSLAGRVGKKLEEHYTWGPINATFIRMKIYRKGQTEQDNPFSLATSECSSPSTLFLQMTNKLVSRKFYIRFWASWLARFKSRRFAVSRTGNFLFC